MTINLPYIALSSKDYDDFIIKLTDIINFLCSEQNKVYKSIAETSSDCAPLLWQYGAFARLKKGEKIGNAIKDGYFSASIGYMGLAECVYHFGEDYCSKKGHKLGLKIFKTMFDVVNLNKEKYHLALSLYGTPAENTTTKFAEAIKVFPKEEHVNDRDYITNSYHIPVEYDIDGYHKLLLEKDFQDYSLGGNITYCELPDINKNPKAVENLISFIEKHMLYCELNTTSCGVCYKCGYEGQLILHKNGKLECPNCHNKQQSLLYYVLRLCG